MSFYDDLFWMAATVKMEAEGEPYEGKLAVAWVIANRMRRDNRLASQVCLAPHQFSCWNTESPTRDRLEVKTVEIERVCYQAACAAYFRLVPDPTQGACFYFNPHVVLPSWAARMIRTTIIGNHAFYREAGVGSHGNVDL